MPALSAYAATLDYAYAPGIFPTVECLRHRPGAVRRVLVHSKAEGHEGLALILSLAAQHHIRVETADRALARISGKENCFAAAVFSKFDDPLSDTAPHVVLHHPSDAGNVGTILRTALGFGLEDIALITPCVDLFDPRTVRASMGSLFSLRVQRFADFDQYRTAHPAHALYPFMLDGSASLPSVLEQPLPPRWSLIFGNEGSGLPPAFAQLGQPVRIPSNDRIDSLNLSVAAAIGIWGFAQHSGLTASEVCHE